MSSGVRRFLQVCHPTGRRSIQVSVGLGLVAVLFAVCHAFGLIVDDGAFGRTFAAWLVLFAATLVLMAIWAVALTVRVLGKILGASGLLGAAAPSTESGDTSIAHRPPIAAVRASPTRWLALPGVAATTVVLLLAIESLSWSLFTEPRLDDRYVRAESSAAGDPSLWVESTDSPAQVGRFTIDEVHRSGANVAILDENAGFLWDRGGIAYLPDGPGDISGWPWGGSKPTFEVLGDHWYSWSQSY